MQKPKHKPNRHVRSCTSFSGVSSREMKWKLLWHYSCHQIDNIWAVMIVSSIKISELVRRAHKSTLVTVDNCGLWCSTYKFWHFTLQSSQPRCCLFDGNSSIKAIFSSFHESSLHWRMCRPTASLVFLGRVSNYTRTLLFLFMDLTQLTMRQVIVRWLSRLAARLHECSEHNWTINRTSWAVYQQC